MNEKQAIQNFVHEVEIYQSNHYGYYDRNALVQNYDVLPDAAKKYLTPPSTQLKSLWRGCDGISETRAISFTSNQGYAGTFGIFNLPFSELKSYSALISTDRLLKLASRLKLHSEVGDDEGEVIVLNPVWKATLSLEKYRV
jgi:hypothetical protein